MGSTVVITGGAGYIGSHVNLCLLQRGFQTVVVDNLSTGHRAAVHGGVFVQGDIRDASLLDRVFSDYPVAAVMHFCARSLVGESVKNPLAYFDNNVGGTVCLIQSMLSRGVGRLVFSSTAAVYGEPDHVPIKEEASIAPTNPYGVSKAMVETILEQCSAAYPFSYIALRYFNAAGADPHGQTGEDHDPETHLVPTILKTLLGQQDFLNIYGTDYPTPDGTAIRDYIHVWDLAEAHALALESLLEGRVRGVFNLGNERGYSVREVVRTAESVVGKKVPVQIAERRHGDPTILVADSGKSRRVLGWRPRLSDLDTIVGTAWNWHSRHPFGFGRDNDPCV